MAWLGGNAFILINKVTLRRPQGVLGWVTVCGHAQSTIIMNQRCISAHILN